MCSLVTHCSVEAMAHHSLYRHFKTDKLVRVLAVSQDTESPGTYYGVYQCSDGSIWNRPYDMFLSEVDHKKYPDAAQKYRFELVSSEVKS